MTARPDPDVAIAAWLQDEAAYYAPERLLTASRDRIRSTDQRRAWWPARRTQHTSRTAVAAAAVVAMVALGGAFAVFGGPGPTPSVHPSPSLPGVVAPSSTPIGPGPSARPTPSAVASQAGVWIATGTMNTPRTGLTAVRLPDGRVLVVGGAEDENDTSAELYDPDSGTWAATGSMLRPHQGSLAALLSDGKVLVGDVDDPASHDPLSGAEVYDPASGTWTATGKMVSGDGSTATLLRDGKVLVIGYGDTGELYDPDSRTWTATGKMTTPRHSHVAILLPDGDVLVAGGHAPGDQPTDSAELYDPDTGTWTPISNMQAPREAIEAFLQADGKVLVVGGSGRGGPQAVEVYDPASGTWTVAGEIFRPGMLVNESTTLLSDGRVLVTDATFESVKADLFDPSTGSWTTAAPMLRSHGTPATLLLDGTVLVAGGRDCLDGVCVPTGSAELYVPRGVSPPALPAFPSPPPPVIPSPTPRPTPYPPQAGVVPSGARTWTVTVANGSSEPATLFTAEDGENGPGRTCGDITPSVVPPDTTMKVTFLLPPKSEKSCWIWLNAVPGEGGSFFQTSDAPMKGEFIISADGQPGWLSR